MHVYSGILKAPDTVWTLYRRENWLLRKTLFDNYVSPAGVNVTTWENRAITFKKKENVKRALRRTSPLQGLRTKFSRETQGDSRRHGFIADGHQKTSKATPKQLALARSSLKAPTISIFDSLDRQFLKQRAQSFFCSLKTWAAETDSWGNVARRARWQDLFLDLPESDGQASKTAIRAWKGALSDLPIFEKRSKMVKIGRHVIQSWYLARISRSEMRMVTTCPRTKSPHESQLFYGSTTEFNGSDAAEK